MCGKRGDRPLVATRTPANVLSTPVACALAGVIFATTACKPSSPIPPARLPGVPVDAIWVGGTDGGDWIRCEQRDRIGEHHGCVIYSDQSAGHILARGGYRPARQAGGKWLPIARSVSGADYGGFDGEVIHLQDGCALVPEGDIDHPFGDGHGKVTTYKDGREVAERAY